MNVDNIAVIGAGTMGHGIAQVFALAGFQIALTDNDDKILGNALPRIRDNLQTCIAHNFVSEDEASVVPSRITLTPDLADAASEADFIVEAVFEDLAVKHEVLRQLEAHCSTHTIITSNSSSFRVADMAIALNQPERFLVTHFWNPPHLIPLVEVVHGEQTSAEAIETTSLLLKVAGKYPAQVRKDVPGFVGNRLQHALRREAIAIVADEIATPEDVDLIARLSFGLRMPVIGPLETADLGGLDLTLAIQTYLLPELDRSTEPTQLVRDKIAQGELGAKTGKGFYDWSPDKLAEAIQQRDEALLEILTWFRNRDLI
ncbi:3-hydroxyacyl-CoA dehydrogenase family protein [Candidatus Poribacteria bacterium]|nr:3-hydroxyacyl-CoA dehydrogenase family protein [Candidatus Poribacteria bacterium]